MSVPAARLATADPNGFPHIVTSTFVVDGDRVCMVVDQKPKRSRDLKRLRNIQSNPHVAVLADHYDEDWEQLWWARADGEAEIVDDPAAMEAPIRLLADRYRQYRANPPAGPVIMIAVRAWTGWAYRV